MRSSIEGWVENSPAKPGGGRMVEEHLLDLGGRLDLGMAGDALQRADHGVGVLGELDSAGVGQIFALARHGEAERDGEQAGEEEDGDGDQDEDECATAATTAPARAAAAPADRPQDGARRTHQDVADQRDDADEHGGDDQQLHVAVLDVGELVGEHRLELGVVEGVHQAAGDGDGVLALADAAGEGVARVGLDDAQARHGDAAADAQRLQDDSTGAARRAGRRRGRRWRRRRCWCWRTRR